MGYAPIRTPSRRLLATPTPMPMTPGFKMMQTPAREEYGVPATPTESSLPFIKPEDYQVRAEINTANLGRPCVGIGVDLTVR